MKSLDQGFFVCNDMTEDLPFELRKLISQAQSDAAQANSCDYKATYQAELDGIRDRILTQWEAGLELIASCSEQELERCKALWKLEHDKHGYRTNELVTWYQHRPTVVVPAYVTMINRVRQLAKVFET